MSRILYIDAPFGISGDMMAAALLDLGASYEKVQEVLASLPVRGFATEISRVKKAGLDMCDFLVKLDREHENHDHDMAYLHGHDHDHEHHHEHHHEHGHDHDHEHHHHSHHHEHRGMPEIREILSDPDYRKAVKTLPMRYFPPHWWVFFLCCKLRFAVGVYMLLKCMERMK